MKMLTIEGVKQHIAEAELRMKTADLRALRLWEQIRIEPATWEQHAHTGHGPTWVIGVLGKYCVCWNGSTRGWGWSHHDQRRLILDMHYHGDAIHDAVFQSLWTAVGYSNPAASRETDRQIPCHPPR